MHQVLLHAGRNLRAKMPYKDTTGQEKKRYSLVGGKTPAALSEAVETFYHAEWTTVSGCTSLEPGAGGGGHGGV